MSATVEAASIALGEALHLAELGYKLTPVTITRAPTGKKQARFHKGWRHEAAWSNDVDQIRAWWVDHSDTSFAIGCAVNGIEGVDLDVKPAESIDAVTWWAQQGLPVSSFEQRTPSGGCHLIWRTRDDGLALPQEAGKSFGRGVDTRNRAGLFFAAGGYVVGEPNHYQIVGTLPSLAELESTPRDVVELFAEAAEQERAERPTDGRIVIHDKHWQRAQVELALQAIHNHDRSTGDYRRKLQHAGLFLGRAVEQGFLAPEQAFEQLATAHRSVWGPELWPENVKDIRDALVDGPRLERWRVPTLPTAAVPSAAEGTAHVNGAIVNGATHAPEETAPAELTEEQVQRDAWEAGVDLRLRNRLMEAEARRRQQAMERDPLEVLDLDAFLDAPQPDYLLPRAIYRNGTAKVFGPPGGTKSFFVLDMALSLASATSWHGVELEPATVHYVMAEGQATNTARALAWFHHRGVPREAARGRFKAIPQGVLLTPEGIESYLEHVRRDQPALIILDTKNRMMSGEENSGSDSAVLVRAMDELRQAAGGAAVLLVDHTGLGDTSRSRGSNAIEAAMDTELRVCRDEGGLGTAEVTRDKAAEPGALWMYRIQRVEGVAGLRPGTPTPATLVPADGVVSAGPLRLARAAWFDMDQPSVPEEVAVCAEKGADAAKDIFRVLRFVDDPAGIERARITEALAEGPRKHGKSTVTTALALMVRRGWLERPSQGRYALSTAYQNDE